MQQVLRLTLTAFLLLGSQAGSSAQDVAACKVPDAIASTHTPIPYRAISQRMSERGTTRLAVTIGRDGAPTEIAINESSGRPRLDNAAAAHIKARYRWAAGNCEPAIKRQIIVNWWIDGLRDARDTAWQNDTDAQIINVHTPFIRIWALDGPTSTSGSSIGAPPY